MKCEHFIITGVTGLVGQHVLYELLRKYLQGFFLEKIILLVRAESQEAAQTRIVNLLTHAEIPDDLTSYPVSKMLEPIEVLVWNLGQPVIIPESLQLKKSYCLIHLASALDLSRDQRIYIKLKKINYDGTFDLIQQLSPFLKQVTFIGTAYTVLEEQKIIPNPDIVGDRTYRNPYERVKLETELVLKEYCKAIDLELQIVRLGTICGRLIDKPLYYTPTFFVFYGFCRFFYLAAQKQRPDRPNSCRIFANNRASLNITSCDYAAKGILAALNSDLGEITIAQSKNLVDYIPKMLSDVGFNTYAIVSRMPPEQNQLEKSYYRVFGMALSIYTFYEYTFDVSSLRRIMPDIPEPDVEGNFAKLIEYANQRKYRDIIL